MLGPRQQKAVTALRSGRYTKGDGQFCAVYDNMKCHCALAVFLEEMEPRLPTKVVYPEHLDHAILEYGTGHRGTLPPEAIRYYGFRSSEGHPNRPFSDYGLQSVTRLNDDDNPRLTLSEIADVIETNATEYFEEVL